MLSVYSEWILFFCVLSGQFVACEWIKFSRTASRGGGNNYWNPSCRFSSHFCYLVFVPFCVCSNFINAVSSKCNKFFFPLFNVILDSLYWYIYAIHTAGQSSSNFFDKYSLYNLLDLRPSASSQNFLSFGPFVQVPPLFILMVVLSILQGGLIRCWFL